MLRSIGSPDAPHWALSAVDFATRATLTYTGEHRPMTAERRELLQKWVRSTGIDSAVASAFTTEYRFQEDTLGVWIPVQQVLEQPLQDEAHAGQAITCYVIFIGGYYAGGPITWLFLLNEFSAAPS